MLWFDERSGLQLLERHDCLRLLAAEEVGRIGILDGGRPMVLPVNYLLDGEDIVFRSDDGSKVDAAKGRPACFEIDGFDRDRRTGWSVVVQGRLEAIPDLDREATGRAEDLDPWVGRRSHLLRIRPSTISGRVVQPKTEPS